MEDIFSRRILDRPWKLQVRQYLAVPTMDRGDCLKARSIDHAHPNKGGVYAVRMQLAEMHLLLELFDIQPGWRGFSAPDGSTVAMNGPLVRVLSVDFVLDLLVVVFPQRNADVFIPGDNDRLRPDNIAKLQHGRFAALRQCLLDRSPCHLQIDRARQHFLTRMPLRLDLMVNEEEFFACKSR